MPKLTAPTDIKPVVITRPWERWPEETDKAFRAFRIYRDMGEDRSLPKVAEKLGKSSGYTRVLEDWSSAHHWRTRVTDFDRYVDHQERLRARERSLASRRRIQAQMKDAAEALMLPAKALLERFADTKSRAALLEELKGLPAPELVDLVRKSTTALAQAHRTEMLAQGVGDVIEPPEYAGWATSMEDEDELQSNATKTVTRVMEKYDEVIVRIARRHAEIEEMEQGEET